jgi:hypothetical protein
MGTDQHPMKASERIRELWASAEIDMDERGETPMFVILHRVFTKQFNSLAILAELIEGGSETAKDKPSAVSALKVIHTWATVQLERPTMNVLDAKNMLELCEKALKP